MENRLVQLLSEKEEFGKGDIIRLKVTKDIENSSIFKFDMTSRLSFSIINVEKLIGGDSVINCLLNTNMYVESVKSDYFVAGNPIIKLPHVGIYIK